MQPKFKFKIQDIYVLKVFHNLTPSGDNSNTHICNVNPCLLFQSRGFFLKILNFTNS